jgi:hypothetical protein
MYEREGRGRGRGGKGEGEREGGRRESHLQQILKEHQVDAVEIR